eukprot:9402615-Pyramimonas_sp.AAC.1
MVHRGPPSPSCRRFEVTQKMIVYVAERVTRAAGTWELSLFPPSVDGRAPPLVGLARAPSCAHESQDNCGIRDCSAAGKGCIC